MMPWTPPRHVASYFFERLEQPTNVGQDLGRCFVPRVLALIAPLMPPSQPRRSGRGTLRAPAPAASMPSVTSPPQRCAISGSIVSKKVGPGGPRDAGGESLSLQPLVGLVPESSVTCKLSCGCGPCSVNYAPAAGAQLAPPAAVRLPPPRALPGGWITNISLATNVPAYIGTSDTDAPTWV